MASRITINGQSFSVPDGRSVSVVNGAIIVDGVTITTGLSGVVKVVWEGPLASLRADCAVECGPVDGNVEAGNSLTVNGDVKGNARAGNSVKCGHVGGSVTAGNSVHRR